MEERTELHLLWGCPGSLRTLLAHSSDYAFELRTHPQPLTYTIVKYLPETEKQIKGRFKRPYAAIA